MSTEFNAIVWAVGAGVVIAGLAQAAGAPVVENIKHFISCWDGYGLHCK